MKLVVAATLSFPIRCCCFKINWRELFSIMSSDSPAGSTCFSKCFKNGSLFRGLSTYLSGPSKKSVNACVNYVTVVTSHSQAEMQWVGHRWAHNFQGQIEGWNSWPGNKYWVAEREDTTAAGRAICGVQHLCHSTPSSQISMYRNKQWVYDWNNQQYQYVGSI